MNRVRGLNLARILRSKHPGVSSAKNTPPTRISNSVLHGIGKPAHLARYSSSIRTNQHVQESEKLHKNPPGSSLARSNFHHDSEVALNRQINTELSAHYLYLAMATYFDRADVALPGFASYFFQKSSEEMAHALLCARYVTRRGGRVLLESIKAPAKLEWKSGLEAMEEALDLEKQVNEIIVEMHRVANKHGDPQVIEIY
jgi:ferritin heavy chain